MADSGYWTASQLFRFVQIFKAREEIIDETENSTSIYPTVKKINQEFLKEEKLDLIKELWELVSADKIIDPYEENLYFKIAELLKIPRKLANKIKQQNS